MKLNTSDYFLSDKHAITVAERYPQPVFPTHCHDFDELVIVWRGSGLHILNDVPYAITCGDLFYVNARDRHSYESVNELELDNILYCRHRLTLGSDWNALLPGEDVPQEQRYWRLSTPGMQVLRRAVDALARECMKTDSVSVLLSEALFLQVALLLKRFRHAPDSPLLSDAEQLDLLLTALRVSIERPFRLDDFCLQHQLNARRLKAVFKQQTGIGVNLYLRQLRLCKAMDLLRHGQQTIGEVAKRCGFDDSNYFSVVFNHSFGVSPREYRQRFQKDHTAKSPYSEEAGISP
ncbi:HTH-type transcriptional activator RhaR [Brenneria nigrifluens DSM 30175 = ATCC 13028]|uniref:HTH-type transcriptional activator RhaR n=1 Tax=Brenneria nigrifluens DSM 30175 = ATCC 13028 TaxID=1121120 RepID=A0A2U1URB8_9GAMM|nr:MULTISPECIES: HTH-type transcriptional activator RhaR [Brenneria]PWC24205.1 HTH-type transcriptional activator RhaR [Brenneria nigrifluens DSM 30175 = ATCC 13028]QCR06960.1 HTH-type transcriptional activator RhaR [Brenneria nigrifluens DSM 30175 = ATCC 13028]